MRFQSLQRSLKKKTHKTTKKKQTKTYCVSHNISAADGKCMTQIRQFFKFIYLKLADSLWQAPEDEKVRRKWPRRRRLTLQRLRSRVAHPAKGIAAFKGAVDVSWRDGMAPETPFDNFYRWHWRWQTEASLWDQRRPVPVWAQASRPAAAMGPGVLLLALSQFRSCSWRCTCARTKRAHKTKLKKTVVVSDK